MSNDNFIGDLASARVILAAELWGDIPHETAYRAHCGTSMSPDIRAKQEISWYVEQLTADYDALAKYATTPEKLATLTHEFKRYRAKYRDLFTASLLARANVISPMIAGPSNFPVRRNQKRSSSYEKRSTELSTYRIRALGAIHKALCPKDAPIMSGDSDACARLEEKISTLERQRDKMKLANKIIRQRGKSAEQIVAELIEQVKFGPKLAAQCLVPDAFGQIGFPDYELANTGKEIRRLRGRLEDVSTAKVTEDVEIKGALATFSDSPADNRVRLFYQGKPDADTRARLKGAGFRWAPSSGAWQAYRNDRAIQRAKEFAQVDE